MPTGVGECYKAGQNITTHDRTAHITPYSCRDMSAVAAKFLR